MQIFEIKDPQEFFRAWMKEKDAYHKKMRKLPFIKKLMIIERLSDMNENLCGFKKKNKTAEK